MITHANVASSAANLTREKTKTTFLNASISKHRPNFHSQSSIRSLHGRLYFIFFYFAFYFYRLLNFIKFHIRQTSRRFQSTDDGARGFPSRLTRQPRAMPWRGFVFCHPCYRCTGSSSVKQQVRNRRRVVAAANRSHRVVVGHGRRQGGRASAATEERECHVQLARQRCDRYVSRHTL